MFLVGVRKIICTATVLDAQELYSWSIWKADVCIFLLRLEVFVSEMYEALIWCWLNNFLQADRCFELVKCFKTFNFNLNF